VVLLHPAPPPLEPLANFHQMKILFFFFFQKMAKEKAAFLKFF
jgi:hypothetical protein